MLCTDCRAVHTDEARFCKECGRRLNHRLRWWHAVWLGVGLFWAYTLVVMGQHTTVIAGIHDPELCGRFASQILMSCAIAYGIAGRKKVRNWRRYSAICFWCLIILPVVPLLTAS